MASGNRISIGWIAIFALMAASIAGIFYSFWILFGSLVFFAWALYLTPHAHRQEKWERACDKLKAWKKGEGARPTEDDLRSAAQWYMRSDWVDYRSEDLSKLPRGVIPVELYPYMVSENDMPRRWRERV